MERHNLDYALLEIPNNTLKEISKSPDRANELVEIRTNSNFDGVIIYDLLGKVIKKYDAPESTFVRLDVSAIANGVYLVEIFGAGKHRHPKKLIIN